MISVSKSLHGVIPNMKHTMSKCFYLQYTPAIDIWSIGCIFAEMLTGKPLFPGKNVVHQLDLMTDLLGTPPPETIARVSSLILVYLFNKYCLLP